MSTLLGQAAPLHLRLFVENVEVPVIGAFVSAQEGSPATAQVEVVPANAGLGLAPRSKVLLFYLDPGDVELGRDRAARIGRSSGVTDARALTEAGYKLLFSGELFSITYSKSGTGSRELVLQCLDDSNNWDTSYLYTLQYSSRSQESVTAGDRSAFLAINTGNGNPLDDILNDPVEVIRQIALRQKAMAKSISGPSGLLGGLLGILELIGGVSGKFVGITAWHTIQEARVRLIDQIGTDSGDTAQKLFDISAFEDWLVGAIGQKGTVISFRELIDLICRYIYYGVVPNPVGVYRQGERKPPAWPQSEAPEDVSSTSRPNDDHLHPDTIYWRGRVIAMLRDEFGWNGSSPDKPLVRISHDYNAKFDDWNPRSPHRNGFAVDYGITESGFGYNSGNRADLHGNFHSRLEYWCEVEERKNPQGALDRAYARLMTGEGSDPGAVQRAKRCALFYKDLGRAVDKLRAGSPPAPIQWGVNGLASAWTRLNDLRGDPVHVELRPHPTSPASTGTPGTSPADLAGAYSGMGDREQLLTQVFRPDVWFVPPPTCNVIFPEEVTNLSFSRDMLRETTRLQLTTYDAVIGDDSVVNETYFAPQIEGTESLASAGLGSASRAFIYPHEKLSGIVPKMERMSDLSFYARLPDTSAAEGATPVQPQVAPRSGPQQIKLADSSADSIEKWASHAALFTYLSYRYSARSVSVTLKFTPRLVCGFPALVIDRTAPEGSSPEERVKSGFSPNHFLGMIRSLSHTLSQGGGSTSITLSHSRTHKTDADDAFTSLLYGKNGIVSGQVQFEEITTVIKIDLSMSPDQFNFAVRLRERIANGMDPAAPKDLVGPNGRDILGPILIVPVPHAYSATGTEPGRVPYSGPAPDTPEDAKLLADFGYKEQEFPFSQVTVTEKGATSFLPLEEAIRPPWVSDEYSNTEVGKLYGKLFGCKSIMDIYKLKPGTLNDIPFTAPGIAEAVEKIVEHYSRVSQGGYLGESFIRELTARDHATLGEVIGGAREKDQGFFWQASGDFSGLEGTLFSWMTHAGPSGEPPTTQTNPTEDNTISPLLDPRKERWERALAYRDELLRSAGQRG